MANWARISGADRLVKGLSETGTTKVPWYRPRRNLAVASYSQGLIGDTISVGVLGESTYFGVASEDGLPHQWRLSITGARDGQALQHQSHTISKQSVSAQDKHSSTSQPKWIEPAIVLSA